ncbi:hypothetical protein L210DRAFT_3482009 [Boletus edulis BED1]|uniref:DASH complex subunit DAM1 n=1 Tax=Boletus edulis BED1 TaxID=1328754 RepID=A0AAD4BRD4_BOLED|nr:hypothetical protein L210DRAFT_3482009 [Boletus edulis BED1]
MQYTPHRTPLRRVSQGSLFALSRSEHNPNAPHGLGFIEPVMAELVDEAEALHANLANLGRLSTALRSFNESFASWLYVMDMNALTTDWLQAPTDASFQLARKRAEQDAIAAAEAAKAPPPPPPPVLDATTITDVDKTTYNETADYDTTAITSTSANTKSALPKPVPKKKGKPKLTAKEKKERMLEIEKIIMSLPLEFRGSDPGLRRHMEMVIEFMIDSDGRGVKLTELIKPPDLNQARVNKCLIALVNRKIVHKDSASGSVLYHWHGLA